METERAKRLFRQNDSQTLRYSLRLWARRQCAKRVIAMMRTPRGAHRTGRTARNAPNVYFARMTFKL